VISLQGADNFSHARTTHAAYLRDVLFQARIFHV
jgi:hypothetical protein